MRARVFASMTFGQVHPLFFDAQLSPSLEPLEGANLPLERVFREAESAGDTQRAALQGRARLAALAAARIEQGVAAGVFATADPGMAARFIITLFDNVLYEALVYEDPGRADAVAAAALRFSLAGLGVPLERARALSASLENP